MSKVFMEMEVFNAIIDEKGELEKSNSVLRKQSQGYLEDLRAANTEIKDLEEKLKELDRYKALAEDLNNQNLNLLKIKSELQRELDATEAENESLYNQLIKRNDELLKMKDECERLKKANRELEDETYDLEDSNIEYYNMMRAERDAVSKLKEELKFVKNKNEILMEDLVETDHHLDEALDELSLMQYDNDNLVEENLDLKNTEKVLRYQIDEMCKQLEEFRKRMHLDITHDDEEAEGTYYPRTFQEGMREITHLYEGLIKSIDKQNDAYDLKCDDFIRIDKENDILREKLKNFYYLTQELETLAGTGEVWIEPVKELVGVTIYD
jgi:chromosome segregation ATPase